MLEDKGKIENQPRLKTFDLNIILTCNIHVYFLINCSHLNDYLKWPEIQVLLVSLTGKLSVAAARASFGQLKVSVSIYFKSNVLIQIKSWTLPFAVNLVIFELCSRMSLSDSAPSTPSLFSDKSFGRTKWWNKDYLTSKFDSCNHSEMCVEHNSY